MERANKITTQSVPFFEHIVIPESESFLWRMDDYPREHSVWNIHPEYEIHLIRKSSGIAFVGDHVQEFAPGYLALIGGGLPHDWVTKLGAGRSIEGRDIVLQFSANRIKDASAIFPECMDLEGLLDRSRQGLLFRGSTASDAAGLMEKIGTLRGFDRLCGFFDLMKVLAKSDDYKILSSSQFSLELDRATLEILQRVLSFLSLNFTRDVRLAEAAAIAKMAESKFSRFFKLNTGISFTDHLTRLRLRQAATLLAETNIPITNLCFDCGYSNIPNFNRRFLEHYHVTPSAYRRLLRHRRVIRTVGR